MIAPVIIVGAGPVGLALALGLSRVGVESIVLERKARIDPHSRAPVLLPRSLETLRAWGVLESFLARGQVIGKVPIWVPGEGMPRVEIDLQESLRAITPTPWALVLPQPEIERLLADELDERVSLRRGWRLLGFVQDAEGVTAWAEHEGHHYAIRGSYLVGCDGAHSLVREILGLKMEGSTYPRRFMLADLRFPDARSRLPWPRVSPEAWPLFALKLDTSTWRLISMIDMAEAEASALEGEGLSRRVEALFGPGPFERIWSSAFVIHRRLSSRFRAGRVFLAGDAAHLVSPAGGQGMNAGIEDARNLAWKIGRSEALLDSYEAERMMVLRDQIGPLTEVLTRFVMRGKPGPVLGRLFGYMLRRRRLIRAMAPRMGMLKLSYRGSPILAGAGPWLGERAPNLPLSSGRTLHDLATEGPALLLVDREGSGWTREALMGLLADFPDLGVHRLVKAQGPWQEGDVPLPAWEDLPAGLTLLRPDGYVGYQSLCPGPEQLMAGLRRALGEAELPSLSHHPSSHHAGSQVR